MDMLFKKYKDKDLLILAYLRSNARMKLTDMSRKSRIPVSTLFDRIISFNGSGLVRKNSALLDFDKMGYKARVLLTLSCRKSERKKLQAIIETHPSMNSLYKVNNGWDFIVEMLFRGVKDVEDFIEGLEQEVLIKNKGIFYILDELKREEFLAKPYMLGRGK